MLSPDSHTVQIDNTRVQLIMATTLLKCHAIIPGYHLPTMIGIIKLLEKFVLVVAIQAMFTAIVCNYYNISSKLPTIITT